MVDIFDEVDEDLRADRAQQLMRRYGGLATAAAVAVVLGVGVWQGWNWWQQRAAGQAATAFLEVARGAAEPNADIKAIAGRFSALATDAPTGYRTLSRLRAAALLADSGDAPGALAIWDQLARDDSADRVYRDLAALLWALHGLDSAEPAALEARLAPLLAEGPWRASAREIQALLAIRQGNAAAARQRLRALADDANVPQGVRDRATRLLTGIAG